MSAEAPEEPIAPERPEIPLVVAPLRKEPKATLDVRFGWPAAALSLWCGVAPLVYPLLLVLAVATTAARSQSAFEAVDPAHGSSPASLVALVLTVLLVELVIAPTLAIVVLLRSRRVIAGSEGRMRFFLVAVGALLYALGQLLLVPIAAYVFTSNDLTEPSLFGEPPGLAEHYQLFLAAASGAGLMVPLILGAVVGGIGSLLRFWSAFATWWLIPRRIRSGIWTVVDVVLVIAFTAVTLLLPLEVPANSPDGATLPAIRVAVTTVAAMRLLVRLIPPILDVVERFGFRSLVAARLLRARKSGFLTVIGFLSIGAVTVATCMLTTTLSVMGGFRNDLKQKILGNNAHVVVDRERGTFEGWQSTLESVRGARGVIAASPYADGEVMITSATNHAGAILRGVDASSVGRVTELRRNLRHGRLEYLDHPERLLRLRSEEMDAPLLEGGSTILRDIAEDVDREAGAREDRANDAEEASDEPAEGNAEAPRGEPVDPDIQRITDDIDDFLLPAPARARVEGESEEVLPGLIVGQELARTLRLHVGDEVNVVSPLGELGPSGPMPKSRPFRIAGIFYSGMYEFDMKMAYTALPDAQRFLGIGDAIGGIEIKVEDSDRAEVVSREIANTIGRADVRVRPWQEVNRTLFGALQLEKLAMFVTLGVAILVASFCVVGTLTLMVQEKRKEVGILKAMGATSEQIVAVFMAQGLMIGLLGAVAGLGLGYVVCFVGEHFGVALNPEVYYIDRLPVHIDHVEFTLVGIAAVLICLLATIYPALLGSRLRPVEALSYT